MARKHGRSNQALLSSCSLSPAPFSARPTTPQVQRLSSTNALYLLDCAAQAVVDALVEGGGSRSGESRGASASLPCLARPMAVAELRRHKV